MLSAHGGPSGTNTRHAVVLLVCLCAALSFPVQGAAAALSDEIGPFAKTTLEEAIGLSPLVQGATAGIRFPDGSIWLGAAGYRDTTHTSLLMPTDEMRIGSQTKTYTATVVLQLVGEGVISLDQTVAQLLPSLKVQNADRITVRYLLDMRSGIPEYLIAPSTHGGYSGSNILDEWALTGGQAVYTPEELVSATNAMLPTNSGPGQEMSYSNTNFVILGLIAEAASCRTRTGCQSIENLVTHRIIEPLGLTGTSFPTTSRFTGDHSNGYAYAVPGLPVTGFGSYDQPPATSQPVSFTSVSPSVPWSAGALISTSKDELVWIEQLTLNTHSLLPASLQTQRLAPIAGNGTVGDYHQVDYRLGIYSFPSPCNNALFLGHAGSIPGYTSAAFRRTDLGIDYAVNVNAYVAPGGIDAVKVMLWLDQIVSGAFARSGKIRGSNAVKPANSAMPTCRLAGVGANLMTSKLQKRPFDLGVMRRGLSTANQAENAAPARLRPEIANYAGANPSLFPIAKGW